MSILTDKNSYAPGDTVIVRTINDTGQTILLPDASKGLKISSKETGKIVYPDPKSVFQQQIEPLHPGQAFEIAFNFMESGTFIISVKPTNSAEIKKEIIIE
jgi:hypothetical protein